MTIEERFERIEHLTAGLAEERRKDREEYRMVWRGTQRQLNEASARLNDLTIKIAETNDAITHMGEEMRDADRRVREEMREADKRLGERIDSLVSAIGKFIARENGPA